MIPAHSTNATPNKTFFSKLVRFALLLLIEIPVTIKIIKEIPQSMRSVSVKFATIIKSFKKI